MLEIINCTPKTLANSSKFCDVDSVSHKPRPLGCVQHFDHPKIEHQFKPHTLVCGGASIF